MNVYCDIWDNRGESLPKPCPMLDALSSVNGNDSQAKHNLSAFADMLHDTERNQKYYQALKVAVNQVHRRGQLAHVLDIGTGSGLLSMMAAACGADSVTACEVFQPMAECAQEIIIQNGFERKIKLIKKRSNEVTVGLSGCDMPQRANILVAEVFDTELIGEGALGTFHHALTHLLTKDCIVVPSRARVYAQVVSSEQLRRCHSFHPIRVGNRLAILPPSEVVDCPGTVSLHDLQLSQLDRDSFVPLIDPIKVFEFDFTGQSQIEFDGNSCYQLPALESGTCDAVFMWWDLDMDPDGEILLSCAPSWAHPEPDKMQWRDHWMQAIYYPQTAFAVDKEEEFLLYSYHDEYSLWFDITKPQIESEGAPEPPTCLCGAHIACSRPRLGMINDTYRNDKYIQSLQKVVTPDTICLSISDGSLVPLLAALLGAKKVYTIETEPVSKRMIENFVQHNNLQDKVKVIGKRPEDVTSADLDDNMADVVIGEPYFYMGMLPWHHIHFWYARTEVKDLLTPKAKVLPCCATMRAIGVDLKDLWKIRAPIGICEGFNLQPFDKILEESSDIADAKVEPHPLWEYPSVPLTDSFGLLQLDFAHPLAGLRTVNRTGYINFTNPGTCNGVAIWMEYHHDNKTVFTTGLMSPPKSGQNLEWENNMRQGVYLFKNPVSINPKDAMVPKLRYKVTFKPSTGEFDFAFAIS